MKIRIIISCIVLLSACGGADNDQPPTGGDNNIAPTISGNPNNTIKVGQIYNFTPNAVDPEGDSLIFSIINKPSWLEFDTATGGLLGTPTSNDAGEYADIQISVSDHHSEVALDSFSLIVVSSTSTTLSWTPHTKRTDGSALPLTELAGFNVYSGTNPDNLLLLISIPNASATKHKLSNLNAGTYYYAVSAYNVYGSEGVLSEVVSKTIN